MHIASQLFGSNRLSVHRLDNVNVLVKLRGWTCCVLDHLKVCTLHFLSLLVEFLWHWDTSSIKGCLHLRSTSFIAVAGCGVVTALYLACYLPRQHLQWLLPHMHFWRHLHLTSHHASAIVKDHILRRLVVIILELLDVAALSKLEIILVLLHLVAHEVETLMR